MKKNFLALVLAAISACTIGISTNVSAYGGWDNDGHYWEVMRGVSCRESVSSVSFFNLFTESLDTLNIMYDGCVYGSMTPQFNKQYYGDHRARVYIQHGSHGGACDGIVSSPYETQWTEVVRSSNVKSKWATCYYSEVLFQGYSYIDD